MAGPGNHGKTEEEQKPNISSLMLIMVCTGDGKKRR